MDENEVNKPMIHEFRNVSGWRRIPDFIDYNIGTNNHREVYVKSGFRHFDDFGDYWEVGDLSCDVFIHADDPGPYRFLVRINADGRAFPVAIPDIDDYLEFMRLYLPVIEASERLLARRDAVSDAKRKRTK